MFLILSWLILSNLAILDFGVGFLLLIDVGRVEALSALVSRLKIVLVLSWELSIDSVIVSESMIILHEHGLVLTIIIISKGIVFETLIGIQLMSTTICWLAQLVLLS